MTQGSLVQVGKTLFRLALMMIILIISLQIVGSHREQGQYFPYYLFLEEQKPETREVFAPQRAEGIVIFKRLNPQPMPESRVLVNGVPVADFSDHLVSVTVASGDQVSLMPGSKEEQLKLRVTVIHGDQKREFMVDLRTD